MRMQIEIEDEKRNFEPGRELTGRASWVLETPPEEVHLRLFWYTEGKGTQDVEVAQEENFGPLQEGRREFRFKLPESPYSFSGRLISIRWGLELVAEPSGETQREDLVMGPGGREVEVHESA